MEIQNIMVSKAERVYAMLIHLLHITGYGILISLILWLVKRNSSKFIDENGKIVFNWFLSFCIYSIMGVILALILISQGIFHGLLLLYALVVCYQVFLIIGSRIYSIIGVILALILISQGIFHDLLGCLLLYALIVCYQVFLIIGSVKAFNGKLWPYPMSIKFLK